MVEIRDGNPVRCMTYANRRVAGRSDPVSPAQINGQCPVFIIRHDDVGDAVAVQVARGHRRWILTYRKWRAWYESKISAAVAEENGQTILTSVRGMTRIMKDSNVWVVIAVEICDRDSERIGRHGKIFAREVSTAIARQD